MKPAPFSPSERVLDKFESRPRFIANELVNQVPLALPKSKRVKAEPSIPPLIKVRRNEFSVVEDSPRESLGFNRDVLNSLRSAMPGVSAVPAAFFHQPRERILRRSAKDFEPGLSVQEPGLLGQNVEAVQLINLKGQNLEKIPKFWSSLARHAPVVRILVLSGCGLSKMDPLELPLLRLLDFSDNQIGKDSVLLTFLKGCPALQEFDFRGNPIRDILSVVERATALLPSLETINGATVELEARVRCVEAHHKRGKVFAQTVRWEWTVCSLSGVADSPKWEPQNIRKLILPKCNLTVFHVKPFVNLELLDLSDNLVSNVVESGISFCEVLRVCDLRQNAIAKRDQLVAFQFNLELKQLFLMGNEVTKLKDYRSFVIVSTRACYGSNFAPGILELDGEKVTLEERCAAVELHAQKTVDSDAMRWQLSCVDFFGRAQYESQAGLAKYCILPDKMLAMAALDSLINLRVLDLSRNNLTTLSGLEKLSHLLYLDLSNNPKLNLTQVLGQLMCATLQQVMFFVDDGKNHARSDPTKPAYRNQILSALLLANPQLNYVDEILVSPTERVDTYARLGAHDVEAYRFRLACALQAMKLPRVLHPNYLEPDRKPYRYDSVVYLTNLTDFNLTVCNFAPFVALKELSLRNNKLTDMLDLGLRGLSNLKKLDLANNQIRTPLPAIAMLLDELTSLQLVALSGNPCCKSQEDRAKLISLMTCMKEDFPHLRSIDTEITIRERVSILVESGAVSLDEGDNLRFRAIALQFIPIGIPAEQVTRLDFSNTGLRAAGLVKYVNLRVLLLKGNDIKTLASIQGLEEMVRLEVLDLRNNLLSSLSECSRLIEGKLQALQAIGLSGNKFRKDYRSQLLVDLRYLHLRKSALSSIDDEEITPAELFVAAQGAGTTKMIKDLQQFRFDIAFIRRSPDVPNRSLVTELDLSCVGLELLNLDSFPSLKRLSLANNSLNGKTLTASQVGTLKNLVFLNINNNKVRNLETLVVVLAGLLDLVDLTFLGNPCCGSLSLVEIGKRFERLSDPLCKLQYLNEHEMTVEERCEIAVLQGKKEMDLFRLQFCLYQRRVMDDVQSLDMSKCGLRTCGGLQMFTTLVSLDLSGNNMTVFEKNVFAYLTGLRFLDLCDNDLMCTLDELTEALAACKVLETLKILHSLHDGSTKRRNQYVLSVFARLPSCQKLDGHHRLASRADEEAALQEDMAYKPSSSKRMSIRGVVPLDKQRKRKSIRKVRSSGKSATSSPIVPRIPAITTFAQNNSESDSPKDDTAASPSSSSSSREIVVESKLSPKSPKTKESKSPGRESRSPGREAKSPGSKKKKGHARTKSGGRKKDVDVIGPGSPAVSPAMGSSSSGSSKHKRSDSGSVQQVVAGKASESLSGSASVVSSKLRGSIRSSASSSLLTPASPVISSNNAANSAGAAREARAKTTSKRPSSSSVKKKSMSLRGSDDAAREASLAPPAPILSQDLIDRLEREQAIKDLEAFEPVQEASEAGVDDHVISSAAQFLRDLDLGSSAGGSSSSRDKNNSDDEYAESDEAEWKDLSDEEETVVPEKRQVDPRLVLAELELFRVGEGWSRKREREKEKVAEKRAGPEVEVEEEEMVPANADSVGGGLRDKFDMGTARGSSASRGKLK